MRSSWRLRLVGIILACSIVWLLADRTLSAGKPEGPRPAGSVRLTGAFEPAVNPQGAPLSPAIHVVPRVTAKMAKTWEILQRPISFNFPNETPLEDVLKYLKVATQDKDEKGGFSIYVDPLGLVEAEKNIGSPVQMDLDKVTIATGLKLLLEQLTLIYYVQEDGLVVITCESSDEAPADPNTKIHRDLDELRWEVGTLKHALLQEGRAARSAAPAVERKPEPAAPPAKKSQFRRTVQFGGIGAAPDSPLVPFMPVATVPVLNPLSAQAAATWRRLQTEVDVPFAQETPFEDALRFLKEKSKQDKDDKGLAFYISPIGLQEAEKTFTSAVQLEIEGVPISTALKLMLKQLGMKFSVHDEGFIVIDVEAEDEKPQDAASLLDIVNAIRLDVDAMRRELRVRDAQR